VLSPKTKANIFLISSSLLFTASLFALAVPFRQSADLFYWAAVLFLLLITANALAWTAIFYENKKLVYSVYLAISLLTLVFFPFDVVQIFGAGAAIVGSIGMFRSIRANKEENLHFSYYHAVKRGMNWFFLMFILLASLNVYLSVRESMLENPDRFYQNISVITVKSARPLLARSVESFSPSMTLDEFLVREDYFDPQGFNRGELGAVSSELQLSFLREQVLSIFGIQAEGNEQIMEVLKRVVEVRIRELFAPIEAYLPAIYALLLFLSLRFIIPVMVGLSGFLGGLFFKLAVRAGFVSLVSKTVIVETPELR